MLHQMSEQENERFRLAAGMEDDLRKSRGSRQRDQIRNYSKGAGRILKTDLQRQSDARNGQMKAVCRR